MAEPNETQRRSAAELGQEIASHDERTVAATRGPIRIGPTSRTVRRAFRFGLAGFLAMFAYAVIMKDGHLILNSAVGAFISLSVLSAPHRTLKERSPA